MNDDFNEMILKAHAKSFKRAFETAVRTGTALVFARDGKIVEIKPPYRYELVPIKPSKKKRQNQSAAKNNRFLPQIFYTRSQKKKVLKLLILLLLFVVFGIT